MNEQRALEAGRWRVVFTRLDDRFAHAIHWLGDEERRPARTLLQSIEGNADQPWPPSPPLQELHFESPAHGGRVALLVGMAGNSHWSASIDVDRAGERLTFELACRAKDLGTLESRYQLAPQVRLHLHDNVGQLVFPEGECRLRPLACDEQPQPRLLGREGVLGVSQTAPGGPWPQTVRWGYTLTSGLA